MTVDDAVQALVSECERRQPSFPLRCTPATPLSGGDSPFAAVERYLLLRIASEFAPQLDLAQLGESPDLGTLVSRIEMRGPRRPRPLIGDEIGARASRRIELVPLQPRHTESLYVAAMSPTDGFRWRFRGRYVPPQYFEQALGAGVLSQFAVERRGTGELLGLVVAYDHAPDAGHAAVGFQRVDGRSGGHELLEAMIMFLGYCFDEHGLSRVFFELPEYNDWLVGERSLVVLEATIADYYFHDRRRWAQRIYSLAASHYWDAVARLDRG